MCVLDDGFVIGGKLLLGKFRVNRFLIRGSERSRRFGMRGVYCGC